MFILSQQCLKALFVVKQMKTPDTFVNKHPRDPGPKSHALLPMCGISRVLMFFVSELKTETNNPQKLAE